MAPSRARFPILMLLTPVLAGCGLFAQQRTGGLEGLTRDTPEQAFAYFQAAARLGRHDLEYECFSEEFKLRAREGGFTLDEYLMARPHVYGKTKRILGALLAARVVAVEPVKAPDVASARVVRLRLVAESEGFRGDILVIRKPYWRLGIKGYDEPIEGSLEDLRRHVQVRESHVIAGFPLSELDLEIMGLDAMPEAGDLTRVEVADRWSLLDIGVVFEVEKMETESEDPTP